MRFSKMAVVVDQLHGFKPLVRSPRCKLPSYSQLDCTMLEFGQTNLTSSLKHALKFTNIQRSFSTPCLSLNAGSDEEFDTNPTIEIIGGQGPLRVRALVVEVAIALASGAIPEPVSSGLGGAYFFHARNGQTIAVAKPIDEEPLAFNNPKGFAGRMLGQPGMKRSIRVGETGFREVAAYLLDHDGFAGVPPTALVKISHVRFHVNDSESISAPTYKIASLQHFVDHHSDAGDLGPSGFSVASVHRIGIFDVRLLNLDRHAGNMLVRHGQESYAAGAAELVPIDHGFCLPESLEDPYFEWLHWPQASIPFSESEVEYISNIDPIKDAELLRNDLPSIRESSIRCLMLCTVFLKQATASGLCLADIGEMMTRQFCGGEENWSAFEKLCMNAKASISRTMMNDYGYEVQDCGYEDQDDQEIEVFQFDDNECEDISNQVGDVPELVQHPVLNGKPPKIPRFLSTKSMSGLRDAVFSLLNDDDDFDLNTIVDDSDGDKGSTDDDEDNQKVASGFMRSMSFSEPNCNNDGGGISFGEMSQEEWELFLEVFQTLLPEAFVVRKSMGLSKQRLGTSCEF